HRSPAVGWTGNRAAPVAGHRRRLGHRARAGRGGRPPAPGAGAPRRPPPGRGWAAAAPARGVARAPAPPPDQPALAGVPPAGPPGSRLDAPARGLLRVVAALPATVRARVAAVALTEGGQVELRLRPAGTVRLGPPEDLAPKLL